jgi:hypothetical protein
MRKNEKYEGGKKMKKILWMSRHPWLKSQEEELKRIFGEVKIKQIPTPFMSAEKVVEIYKKGGYDEMVIVAPLSVIAKITEMGIKPLWAEMEIVSKKEAEVEAAGRYYRFVKFRRIKKVKMEFEDL